jgi:hypothetical protein
MMTREESGHSNLFLVGLMAGTAIGAGLALAFAPELRERLTGSATDLGEAASRGYQRVSTRVVGVIENVTERGQTVDDVADAIGCGAREIEQFTEAAKSFPGGWRS